MAGRPKRKKKTKESGEEESEKEEDDNYIGFYAPLLKLTFVMLLCVILRSKMG